MTDFARPEKATARCLRDLMGSGKDTRTLADQVNFKSGLQFQGFVPTVSSLHCHIVNMTALGNMVTLCPC